jgi:OOP family OmpA-OmpF porin
MKALSSLPCLACIVAATLGVPAQAQTFQTQASTLASPAAYSPWGRSYLGLNVGRARNTTACATSSILCNDQDRATEVFAGTMIGGFWGAEMSFMNTGRMLRDGTEGRAQGLNLSLVGRTRLGSSLGVYGKLGTVYSRSETSFIGGSAVPLSGDQGFGLSFGAGVSYDFTPRLSARLEWDSHDLRFNGARDPVRSTSLGLQYRY